MRNYEFVSTRDLKGKINKILRAVEEGRLIIVTRYGNPVATIRPFQDNDLQLEKRAARQNVKENTGKQQPRLRLMDNKNLQKLDAETDTKANNPSPKDGAGNAAHDDE